ncbi:hypothetical protein Nepgr_000539 [Nepenthes gracilis]|uniref:Uncharacterized protein n=1 Tax=Nepenthes gracilis TaxID=150966 RepID=A0AAD3RWV9_NEPGR|nr:hypothetical protein Nepgr_000539 [Nepenthes gracilis]
MSFLAGRLAGKEGAYFFQESKQAVGRLVEKTNRIFPSSQSKASASAIEANEDQPADVLPEVLRHSLPSKLLYKQTSDSSTLSTSSKWTIHSRQNNGVSSVSADVLNPLRGYLSVPQVTFGPKRWQMSLAEHSVIASTANDLRQEQITQVNPEKLKAAAEGLAHIGKAFVVASVIIFGGAAVTFSWAVSKLDIHNLDDIRARGKDLLQPKFEALREQLNPVRSRAERMSRKWHIEIEHDVKEKPIVKELSKILGAKSS